jgi:MFS family permease
VWIYVCIGLSDNLMMLGFLNYLFDIAPPGQRTIYVGTFNAVASIGLLGPVIAGWVVTHLSYPVLFFTSLCFATASLVMALKLPLARQLAPQAQAGQSPADG